MVTVTSVPPMASVATTVTGVPRVPFVASVTLMAAVL